MGQALKLRNGRVLEWADNGIESEHTLIFHNGTTCALDVWNAWLNAAAQQGVRAIGVNRAGIGASTRNQGRRMTDDIADIRELVEELGITKFVSIGWSGGGGRALGTALIPGCVGIHTIAGIPPQDPNDPQWMATVTPERHELGQSSRADWNELLKRRSATYEEDREVSAETMLGTLAKYLPHFADFEDEYKVFAEDFSLSIRQALMHGPEADADDYAANIHLWGFKIDDVKTPVTIWHGDLDDDVQIIYGEYNNCRIPGSKLVRLEGLGHVDIMVEARNRILSAAVESLLR